MRYAAKQTQHSEAMNSSSKRNAFINAEQYPKRTRKHIEQYKFTVNV